MHTATHSTSPVPFAGHDAVMAAFIRHGGLRTDDEVQIMLRRHTSQPLSVLAKGIVQRRIVSITRVGQRWIPLFQFDRATMTVLGGVAAVVAELAPVLDDEELAAWFAMPNRLLDGYAPVRFDRNGWLPVIAAARADRFLVAG
jgi:hypothetical protein